MRLGVDRSSTPQGIIGIKTPLSQSVYFWAASLFGLAALSWEGFIVYLHWKVSQNATLLFALIAVQTFAQWKRVYKYSKVLKEKSRSDFVSESHVKNQLQDMHAIATGGMTEMLFWSFVMQFLLIVYVGFLLGR